MTVHVHCCACHCCAVPYALRRALSRCALLRCAHLRCAALARLIAALRWHCCAAPYILLHALSVALRCAAEVRLRRMHVALRNVARAAHGCATPRTQDCATHSRAVPYILRCALPAVALHVFVLRRPLARCT